MERYRLYSVQSADSNSWIFFYLTIFLGACSSSILPVCWGRCQWMICRWAGVWTKPSGWKLKIICLLKSQGEIVQHRVDHVLFSCHSTGAGEGECGLILINYLFTNVVGHHLQELLMCLPNAWTEATASPLPHNSRLSFSLMVCSFLNLLPFLGLDGVLNISHFSFSVVKGVGCLNTEWRAVVCLPFSCWH